MDDVRLAAALSLVGPIAALVPGCGSSSAAGAPDAGSDALGGRDGSAPAGVLAPTGDTAKNGPVDGISCDTSEQLVFHIHAHLEMFVNGVQKLVPAGVGIGPPLQFQNDFVVGGSCFSWLHTHDETGVIHIESPIQRTFTLGNFFDIWGQPLSADQVGPAHGKISAFLNGKPFTGDPRSIPLDAHNLIQLDVGKPVVPPQPYTFPPGL